MVCVRWDVAVDCSTVTGIFFRVSMHWLQQHETPCLASSPIFLVFHLSQEILSSIQKTVNLPAARSGQKQRRGIEARMWAWLPFTYLSSHYQFFIILTVLGICTGLWWEAEEGQEESRDSHTGSMITTTNNWQICSVHKVFGFLEKMVLGGTTELYHPKNEDNSFAEKPSANLQNSMFA